MLVYLLILLFFLVSVLVLQRFSFVWLFTEVLKVFIEFKVPFSFFWVFLLGFSVGFNSRVLSCFLY